MARTKINYAAQGMFVGPSPATGSHYLDGQNCYGSGSLVKELYRIQGYSYDFNYNKENLGQFGDLANIDYLNMVWPDVNLNFSYLLSNFGNEKNIGFVISSGSQVNALSGIIAGTTEDKNYFIAIHSPEGEDLHNNNNFNYDSAGGIIGFGNGVVTNYSSKTAVGQLPSVDVTVEALNVKVYDKNTSLYTNLMENNSNNAHFDDVGTGGNILVNNFNDWSTFANDTALVKIVSDPTNISESINADVLLQSDPSSDAYFNSVGTGTNWTTNNTGSYVFKQNNQLVYVKNQPISTLLRLPSGNFSYLPSNSWYKVVIDLASGVPDLAGFKINLAQQSPDFLLSTGINIFYNTGIPNINQVLSSNFPSISATGIIYFNKIEIFEPKNFSAKLFATGSIGSSFNYIGKPNGTSIYSILNSQNSINKRFNLSMDVKYSGFANQSKDLFYTSIGTNDIYRNGATIRQPLLTSDFENNFKNITFELSNSPTTDNLYTPELRLLRLFDAPSGELWIDNIKLEQTNKTDIINPNLFNGSFEIYHPSAVNSGIGTINTFSGWIINQNPTNNPYVILTGSSSVPNYDRNKTISSQSLNARIVNATGISNYVVLYPYINNYGTYVKNKRHTLSCYVRCSGSTSLSFNLSEQDGAATYYYNVIANNNEWNQIIVDFTPTGNTRIKLETSFGNTTNNQIWLDDVNLYYYDDCYALPVVESVTGGFNIPVNSTTNFSGLDTNSSNRSLSVLRPQDVYLNINYADLGPTTGNWKLQSCELNVPIPRENIYNLGIDYPSKKFQNPLIGNFTLNAILGDLATGNLRDYYLDCDKTYDINYGFFNPCSTQIIADYRIRKACLTSMEFTNTIGNNKTATMNFIFPIGGIAETGRGLFMSGVVFE